MTDTIARILVPVDFSPHADGAVAYATMLAGRLGATLEFLHVVEDPVATGAWSGDLYAPNLSELLNDMVADAEQRMSVLKKSTALVGITADTAVLTGYPTDVISDHARAGHFDLIVMSTHGRTGLPHLLLGSVAERTVRNAPCPVLTVKSTGALAQEAAA